MKRRALILLPTLLFLISGCYAAQASDRPTPSLRESKSNPPATQSDHHSKESNTKKETPKETVAQAQAPKGETITSSTTEKADNKASSDWWLVAFTGFLVLIGACQIGAMLRQEKWMRKTVEVAKASADAANATVKIMGDTAEKQLRAYVYPVSAERYRDETGAYVIRLKIKNAGQTPAYDCSRYMIEAISDGFPQLPENFDKIPIPTHIPKSPIPPGETIEFFVNATELTPSKEGQIMVGRAAIYLFGKITYRDAFGNSQLSNFRLVCTGEWMSRGVFAPCQDGNEAT